MNFTVNTGKKNGLWSNMITIVSESGKRESTPPGILSKNVSQPAFTTEHRANFQVPQ